MEAGAEANDVEVMLPEENPLAEDQLVPLNRMLYLGSGGGRGGGGGSWPDAIVSFSVCSWRCQLADHHLPLPFPSLSFP